MSSNSSIAPDELVVFYEQLVSMQDQLTQQYPRITVSINEDQMMGFLQQKRFWLQLVPFSLDSEMFLKDYRETAGFILKSRPQIKDAIGKMNDVIEHLHPDVIAEKALQLDKEFLLQTALEQGLSPDLFIFMLQNAMRPQLRAWAESLPKLHDRENWQQPYCPVCGQAAIISRIRPGDGQRSLFCGHCFTEWEYRHLCCPHCGNDDHQSINIISMENDRFNLIYACDKCHGYMKTLNERQGGGKAENLFTEGARTFYLDLLAEREGYHNPDHGGSTYN